MTMAGGLQQPKVSLTKTHPELLNSRRVLTPETHVPSLVYSRDGKYLFQREAHVVQVRHPKTGQLLHECIRQDTPTHTADASSSSSSSLEAAGRARTPRAMVTAMALHPLNSLQLLASYEDGKVLIWDFTEEKVLQEMDVKSPVLWMSTSETAPSMVFLVISATPADKTAASVDRSNLASKWALIEFNIKRKRRGRTLLEHAKLPFRAAMLQSVRRDGGTAAAAAYSSAFEGDLVVLIAQSRFFVVRMQQNSDPEGQGRLFFTQKLQHLREITCVAVHPRTMEFTIGDAMGQLHRYCVTSSLDTIVISTALQFSIATMHWHAHAVHCITYSADGASLLSGGEECVVVSWHLESGRRSYLPRRSAALVDIATRWDGSGYAIALEDHMVFQYNPITREEEWKTLGLARSGCDARATLPCKEVVFDPISRAVVLNGISTAGVLQFYHPFKDRVLQSVVLTERNQVTRTEDEVIPFIVAERMVFNPSGKTLVTLQSNYEKHGTAEIKDQEQALRFWKRREDGSFYVNTAVDAPHGSHRVTSMAFSPSVFRELLVTADARGEFKLWKQSADAALWHCQSVVKFRDTPITAVTFAADCSLLLVAYEQLLTIWDVETNALRHVFPSSDGTAIAQALFAGPTSPYVLLRTEKAVEVWSLLNFELWWRYEVPEDCGVQSTSVDDEIVLWMKVAGADKEHAILKFNIHSPLPSHVHRVTMDMDIWTIGARPRSHDLLIVDMESNLWRIGDLDLLSSRRKETDGTTPLETSALDALYKRSSRGAAAMKKKLSLQSMTRASGNLFDAPAHVLPSMTALYRSFMDTMLPKPGNATDTPSAFSTGNQKNGTDRGSTSKKKNRKRKHKSSSHALDGSLSMPMAQANEEELQDETDTQKRMRATIEQELANPTVHQQTYSKLLAQVRKNRKEKRAPIQSK